ncbi:MAG: hypothetical protein OEL86_11950 [Sulfuritalea sp.]|uniref:hypothetical protein n=1 Tax=Denitratisoma sp. DHT3 TaxID=1981880 RepID=UPI001198CA79|nr:hypothetical protein [Denitratisoma sp. DHT3]MDK9714788.1 hypothetical protein [Sulfuritalea sp.]QDX80983.1 hypothetical protein B9N43_06810 [Denitratisoma sp. DHT3]HMW19032.1 hypothetical protein [Accumulibacter sp.]HNC18994.1 hypothetical protein [Accumulibacter sp.]
MLRNLIPTAVTCLALGIGAIAHAADKHGHDHKPQHGGLIAEAADLDFELVAKTDSLTLYVAHDGKPVATAGAKGTATVVAGSEKIAATFEPAGSNTLVAKGSFKMGVGVRVAVAVTLAGKPEAKLNFRLK